MGKRRTGRKRAVQILYQSDMLDCYDLNNIELYLDQEGIVGETRDFVLSLSLNVWENRKEIDEIIQNLAKNWDFKRLDLIDKSILRLSLYELKLKETPVQIIVNEALEIAKIYSTEKAPPFINGILGEYIKCLRD